MSEIECWLALIVFCLLWALVERYVPSNQKNSSG